jgi:hypothetical protein
MLERLRRLDRLEVRLACVHDVEVAELDAIMTELLAILKEQEADAVAAGADELAFMASSRRSALNAWWLARKLARAKDPLPGHRPQ